VELLVMHFHQQSGVRRHGLHISDACVRFVVSPTSDEFAPARCGITSGMRRLLDFNQFAPRDTRTAAAGQRVQHEEHGGGIVVDHVAASAPVNRKAGFHRIVPIAAAARTQIELQVDRGC